MRDRIAVGVLLAVGLVLAVSNCSKGRELAAAEARVAELQTERLAAVLDSAGWEIRLQEATEGLEERLAEAARSDSTDFFRDVAAELAVEVETLAGRVTTIASMYAEAVGQIEAHDAVVHASEGSAAVPDSITGRVDDGLLAANVWASVQPAAVALRSYAIRFDIVTSVTETADGRALFAARAEDPRIEIGYRETYWQPPPPESYCSLGTRLTWALGGAGLGAIGWRLAP